MFRKNHLSSVLAVSTALFCTTSVSAHINFQRDQWRDAIHADHISDLYIGLQGARVLSNWDDVRRAFDGREALVYLTDGPYRGFPTQVDYLKSYFKGAFYGARTFARWDFTKHFGIEGGISFIDGSEYQLINWGPDTTIDIPIRNQYGQIQYDGNGNVIVETEEGVKRGYNVMMDKGTTVIFDLTWVTRVPLQNNFTFYTKFGGDFMWVKNGLTTRVVNLAGSPPAPGRLLVRGKDQSHVSFTFGLGLNYQFSRCWMGDMSWQYFRGNTKVGDFMPDIHMFMLGISYHIDLACSSKNCLGEI